MIKKIAVRTLLVLLALLLILAIYIASLIWRVTSTEPNWAGELTLDGLSEPVRILRNEQGVPHIFAANEHDLIFAQGFVHAQDYFGQMALRRQQMRGEASEWLGTLGMRADRLVRLTGLAQGAEAAWPQLPEDTRAFLQAYADGVNAWLASDHYRKPPELIALHVSAEPWKPTDSLGLMRLLHLGFSGDGDELLRGSLERSETVDAQIQRMFFANEWPVFPVIDEPDGGTVPQSTETSKTQSFSNSWVLSGNHTASGMPLLANDPHLAGTMPANFSLQRLSGGRIAAAGGTIPGQPGLVFGHNGRVAWGVTSSHVDVVDYVLLELDPDDPARYRRAPDAPWERFIERRETIQVRFGEPFELVVRSTPTGFVMPDDLMRTPFPARGALERHQPTMDLLDTTAITFHQLLTTTSVTETIGAIQYMTGPTMNISMADIAGNIAYVKAGRLWKRPMAQATRVDLAPMDSNEGEFIPFDDNPQIVNPDSRRIVSGNQRIVGEAYPHYLSQRWTSPDRAMRIHELLDAREVHDPDSYLAMQMDTLSPVARRLLPMMLERTDTQAPVLNSVDPQLLLELRDWDFDFHPDSVAPTVFMSWIAELNKIMLLDETGDVALDPVRDMEYLQIDYHSAGMVLRDGPETWCDIDDTQKTETCA